MNSYWWVYVNGVNTRELSRVGSLLGKASGSGKINFNPEQSLSRGACVERAKMSIRSCRLGSYLKDVPLGCSYAPRGSLLIRDLREV